MTHLFLEHPKYLRWKRRIEANGNIVNKADILTSILRDKNKLFGTILDCKILTPEGLELPRCVIICGDSVVIIPVLTCSDDGKIYTLMVEQRRIVDGDYSKEFPAGSIDADGEDPKVTACQEVQEELSITISPEELFPLSTEPIKANPSISGDLAHFFYFERVVPYSFLKEIDGRNTGCHSEMEYINVRVLKMSEVARLFTLSALIGIKLLERKVNCVFQILPDFLQFYINSKKWSVEVTLNGDSFFKTINIIWRMLLWLIRSIQCFYNYWRIKCSQKQ